MTWYQCVVNFAGRRILGRIERDTANIADVLSELGQMYPRATQITIKKEKPCLTNLTPKEGTSTLSCLN